jgi:hypothetical protein
VEAEPISYIQIWIPVEIVLRREEGTRGRMIEGVNLTNIYISTYVNVTMYPPLQLLYTNKIIFKILSITKSSSSLKTSFVSQNDMGLAHVQFPSAQWIQVKCSKSLHLVEELSTSVLYGILLKIQ